MSTVTYQIAPFSGLFHHFIFFVKYVNLVLVQPFLHAQ